MLINKNFTSMKYRNEATEGGEEASATQSYTQEQYDAVVAEKDSMKAKMDELLGETKQAKAKAKAESEAKAKLAEEQAKKNGDFEQLYDSMTEQANDYKSQLEELKNQIANKERDNLALKIAGELADGYNAELLSEHISRRLRYTEDGVKITDSNGQLTVSTVDDLKAEFKQNERYASLLKGNQASGGGVVGGKSSGATEKVLSRSEFSALPPLKQMEHIKSGGKITD